jgi:uncharacterized cupredoxin-like copper-binding protein
MKPTRLPSFALLLSITVLALAGCGGGDGSDDGTTSGATTSGSAGATGSTGPGGAKTREVKMREFEFDPSAVVAKRGSSIKVVNDGNVVHNLKVRRDGEELGGTDTFGPGDEKTLDVDFPAGRYEMYCSVPGHEQSGMKGDFTVK